MWNKMGRTVLHSVVFGKVVQIAGLHAHEVVYLGSIRVSRDLKSIDEKLTAAGRMFMIVDVEVYRILQCQCS